MTLTPYQKIRRAAAAGRGVKLSATECWQLMRDDAIAQVAEADERCWQLMQDDAIAQVAEADELAAGSKPMTNAQAARAGRLKGMAWQYRTHPALLPCATSSSTCAPMPVSWMRKARRRTSCKTCSTRSAQVETSMKADMPAWQIALAAVGIVIILLLLIGTLLGFIDWSDR